MCGIIGYIGKNKAYPLIIEGLRKLEYRGYDSAGIVVCEPNPGLVCNKQIGLIDNISKPPKDSSATLGAGHSRWATTGRVTKENAHPHFDCTKKISIVHNGIIENYLDLKKDLVRTGHLFESETDSEVIAHLIEKNYSGNLLQAVIESVKVLKGSFAFLVISYDESDKLIAVRKESPLIIGHDKNGFFASSDVIAFINHTKNVSYMNDGEICVLTRNNASFYDFEGNLIKKGIKTISWDAEKASKEGYDHFMLKEIHEQPDCIKKTTIQDLDKMIRIAEEIRNADKVAIIACGTSRHAGLVGRYVLMKENNKFCEVILGSESNHFEEYYDKNTIVIPISQSGETADVLCGLRVAKKKGARIISIVNTVDSTIARESDEVLYLNCGPEIGVASTKSFTSQIIIFYLLSFAMNNKIIDGIKKINELSELVKKVIKDNLSNIKDISERISKQDDAYFIGRGINFAVALEGALKLKEISYVHAEGMPAGELKHGTLALIQKGVPTIVIAPKDDDYDETISNALEVKAREGHIIGISDEPNDAFDAWIRIEKSDALFQPFLSVIPLQLLAYYTSISKGINADRPRNLAKCVSVK